MLGEGAPLCCETMDISALMDLSFMCANAAETSSETLASLDGRAYVVALGDSQEPVAVLSASDLDRASYSPVVTNVGSVPPLLVIPPDLTVARFIASDAVTLLDLDPTFAVVLDGKELRGVIPISTLDGALAEVDQYAQGRHLGFDFDTQSATDSLLGGSVIPVVARVVCGRCGYVMRLVFYDRTRPPRCANPDVPEHLFEHRPRA
jgi:hypothetical protein